MVASLIIMHFSIIVYSKKKRKNGRDQKQCASQVFILRLMVLMPTAGLQLTQNDIPSSFKILRGYYKERKKEKKNKINEQWNMRR